MLSSKTGTMWACHGGLRHEALSLNPNYAEAEDDYGMALVQRGKPEDAITHYLKALGIRAHYLGGTCIDLGEAIFRGKRKRAEWTGRLTVYKKSLAIQPWLTRYARLPHWGRLLRPGEQSACQKAE